MKSNPFAIIASIAIAIAILPACQKEENTKTELAKKSEEFNAYAKGKAFVPTEFYADKPVDYIDTDEVVKAETDLNAYIYNYLKDDQLLFDDNGVLRIIQNGIKIPGNDSAILLRKWKISPGTSAVNVEFVDHKYSRRVYRLVEYNDTSFLAYVEWKETGAKLYSKFVKK
ncbi:MAG: hypothetical protein ACXWV5_02465 [Flavitalea sp.]